jgi:hypothetical protein
MKKPLIIIPAFNEEKNIRKVVETTRQHSMESEHFDIVVVCDGARDATAQIVKNMNVSLLEHPINLGAGAAIQTGLKYAVVQGYDIAVVVDGDGQHDPSEISKLIKTIEYTDVDVVIGSRFLNNQDVKTHWARKIGIRLFSLIVSFIGRCKITDATSGFRAFNKRTIKLLSREIPADFPDADMLLFLALSKYKIIEVSVSSRERQDGESMYSLLRSVYYPLKLFISIIAVLVRFMVERGTSK